MLPIPMVWIWLLNCFDRGRISDLDSFEASIVGPPNEAVVGIPFLDGRSA